MDSINSNQILVVDDNPLDLEIIGIACSRLDCKIETVGDPIKALAHYKERRHTLVLTDYKMEPIDGVDLVHRIRAIDPDANCLIITASPDARVNACMADLGLSLITKPIRPTYLVEQLRVAFHKKIGATEQLGEIAISNRMDNCVSLLGQSQQICRVRKQLADLMQDNCLLLIEGPFGVGKPDIVSFIHHSGCYADSELVICHCQELGFDELEEKLIGMDGTFGSYVREAENGTLVLDHVESIPLELQHVLANNMHALSGKCRVISWADSLMDDLLQNGQIDEQLYFVLSLNTIHVPALSQRPEDIEEIVRYVAASQERFNLKRSLSSSELDLLLADLRRRELKGNLREVIEAVKVAASLT